MADSGSPWNLHMFEPKLKQWQTEAQPPDHVYDKARAWWPSLAHAALLSSRRVAGNPQIRYAWVTNAVMSDANGNSLGVQCHYRGDGNGVIIQVFTFAVLHHSTDDR